MGQHLQRGSRGGYDVQAVQSQRLGLLQRPPQTGVDKTRHLAQRCSRGELRNDGWQGVGKSHARGVETCPVLPRRAGELENMGACRVAGLAGSPGDPAGVVELGLHALDLNAEGVQQRL